MSEKINQLMPVEVERNNHGEWIHPEVGGYWESNFGADIESITGEDWSELKRHFNIVTVKMYLEKSVSSDDFDEIMDGCDLSKWNPIAPHGFFLFSINFTEDGAEAIWAKAKIDFDAIAQSLKEVS